MDRAGSSRGVVALAIGAAAALGLILRRSSPASVALPPPRVTFPPPAAAPAPVSFPLSPLSPLSHDWARARLTEFHPDTPATESLKKRKQEGGPLDRDKQPLITVEQHRADPARYPYVSVAADLMLQGRKVPYGVRIYIEALPRDVLRIVDTGCHFINDPKKHCEKQIHEPGHEPFDICTAWPGKTQRLSGKLTRYRIDWDDVLKTPRPRVS